MSLLLVLASCRGGGQVLYVGGPILTMDADNRVVEALLVEGDRIAAVGVRDEVEAQARSGARVIDLEGRALLPGFIDAHGHFPGAGLPAVFAELGSPPLGEVRTIEDLVERLAAQADDTRRGRWVVGIGYDDTLLAEQGHPTRTDLDRVSRDHPVAATHISGHLAAVNSRGLEELGIDVGSADPEGGHIRRPVPGGEPDGVLEETAAAGVFQVIFKPGLLDSLRIVRAATRAYLARGVTTAQNGLATISQVKALSLASRLGLVPLRLVLWPDAEAAEAMLAGDLASAGYDEAWLRIGAVKLVADGSIQAYTGYLAEPYHVPPGDDPHYRGYPRMPADELARQVERFHRAGMQVAVHGNGDAAIDDILDALERCAREHPRADARPVIVHAQMARDDQLDRMRALGVVPSFFALHTYYWGDRHRDRFLGPERATRISPTAGAVERGIRFTTHCDSPVVPIDPLRSVWAAVNRTTSAGLPLGREHRVGAMRALRSVTIDAAYQHFEEAEKGSLEPGKLADLVILSRSPLEDLAAIDRIAVVETIVGGRTVYRAE